jgi:hypothetical protein
LQVLTKDGGVSIRDSSFLFGLKGEKMFNILDTISEWLHALGDLIIEIAVFVVGTLGVSILVLGLWRVLELLWAL